LIFAASSIEVAGCEVGIGVCEDDELLGRGPLPKKIYATGRLSRPETAQYAFSIKTLIAVVNLNRFALRLKPAVPFLHAHRVSGTQHFLGIGHKPVKLRTVAPFRRIEVVHDSTVRNLRLTRLGGTGEDGKEQWQTTTSVTDTPAIETNGHLVQIDDHVTSVTVRAAREQD
jgi:hypothetical protein